MSLKSSEICADTSCCGRSGREREKAGGERRTDLVDCVWLAVIPVEDGEELSVDVGFAGFLDLADVLDGGFDQLGIEHLKVGGILVVWRE